MWFIFIYVNAVHYRSDNFNQNGEVRISVCNWLRLRKVEWLKYGKLMTPLYRPTIDITLYADNYSGYESILYHYQTVQVTTALEGLWKYRGVRSLLLHATLFYNNFPEKLGTVSLRLEHIIV